MMAEAPPLPVLPPLGRSRAEPFLREGFWERTSAWIPVVDQTEINLSV